MQVPPFWVPCEDRGSLNSNVCAFGSEPRARSTPRWACSANTGSRSRIRPVGHGCGSKKCTKVAPWCTLVTRTKRLFSLRNPRCFILSHTPTFTPGTGTSFEPHPNVHPEPLDTSLSHLSGIGQHLADLIFYLSGMLEKCCEQTG